MNKAQSRRHNRHEAKYKTQESRTRKNKIASIKRELIDNPNNILAKTRLNELAK